MGSQESDTETKQQQQEISAPYSNRASTVEKLEKETLRDYMKERKDWHGETGRYTHQSIPDERKYNIKCQRMNHGLWTL